MTIDIRFAVAADIPVAAAVHIESCLDIYRGIAPDEIVDGPMAPNLRALWAAEELPGDDFMVIADDRGTEGGASETGGRLVGLVIARLGPEHGDDPYVEHFHILPSMKGRGIGRRLFDRLAEELRAKGRSRFHLHVAQGNDGALAFYKALGGRVDGTVQGDIFGHPSPADLVRWEL